MMNHKDIVVLSEVLQTGLKKSRGQFVKNRLLFFCVPRFPHAPARLMIGNEHKHVTQGGFEAECVMGLHSGSHYCCLCSCCGITEKPACVNLYEEPAHFSTN